MWLLKHVDMCYHCIGWWPVSSLARDLLGLDEKTPFWLHADLLSDLHEVCLSVLRKGFKNLRDNGCEAWLQKHCPKYKELIEAAAAGNSEPYSLCELNTLFMLNNKHKYNPTDKSNGELLSECKTECKVEFWRVPTDKDVPCSPLKVGRFPLKASEAALAEYYSDIFFYDKIDKA